LHAMNTKKHGHGHGYDMDAGHGDMILDIMHINNNNCA